MVWRSQFPHVAVLPWQHVQKRMLGYAPLLVLMRLTWFDYVNMHSQGQTTSDLLQFNMCYLWSEENSSIEFLHWDLKSWGQRDLALLPGDGWNWLITKKPTRLHCRGNNRWLFDWFVVIGHQTHSNDSVSQTLINQSPGAGMFLTLGPVTAS